MSDSYIEKQGGSIGFISCGSTQAEEMDYQGAMLQLLWKTLPWPMSNLYSRCSSLCRPLLRPVLSSDILDKPSVGYDLRLSKFSKT